MYQQLIIPTLFVAVCVLVAYRVGKRQAAHHQAEAAAARILDDGEWDNVIGYLASETGERHEAATLWAYVARHVGLSPMAARLTIPAMIRAGLTPSHLLGALTVAGDVR